MLEREITRLRGCIEAIRGTANIMLGNPGLAPHTRDVQPEGREGYAIIMRACEAVLTTPAERVVEALPAERPITPESRA